MVLAVTHINFSELGLQETGEEGTFMTVERFSVVVFSSEEDINFEGIDSQSKKSFLSQHISVNHFKLF